MAEQVRAAVVAGVGSLIGALVGGGVAFAVLNVQVGAERANVLRSQQIATCTQYLNKTLALEDDLESAAGLISIKGRLSDKERVRATSLKLSVQSKLNSLKVAKSSVDLIAPDSARASDVINTYGEAKGEAEADLQNKLDSKKLSIPLSALNDHLEAAQTAREKFTHDANYLVLKG